MDATTLLQTRDPETYSRNARFVAELATPVVDPLAPLGCDMVGVDAGAAQVEGARKLGLGALTVDAQRFPG